MTYPFAIGFFNCRWLQPTAKEIKIKRALAQNVLAAAPEQLLFYTKSAKLLKICSGKRIWLKPICKNFIIGIICQNVNIPAAQLTKQHPDPGR